MELRVTDLEVKFKEIQLEMQTKATKIELDQVSSQLTRFALYEDYKKLYNLVIPPLSKFEQKLEEQSNELF